MAGGAVTDRTPAAVKDSARIGDAPPSAVGALPGAAAPFLLAAQAAPAPVPADAGVGTCVAGWDRRAFLTAAGALGSHVTARRTPHRRPRHRRRRPGPGRAAAPAPSPTERAARTAPS
ncbi:hypothetical protein GCM10019017_24520 [Streptomyces showdoensis]